VCKTLRGPDHNVAEKTTRQTIARRQVKGLVENFVEDA
jgi:hypothetical protein